MQYLFILSLRSWSGNLLPQDLIPAMKGLPVQPFLLRGRRRPGGLSFSSDHGHATDEFGQPLQRILLVEFVTSVLLGLDHDGAVLGQPMILECEKPFLQVAVERGFFYLETEMDGAGDLVDILPAGTLSADLSDFNFTERDGNGAGNL
jgi:hypothetical protein